jgi:hypothetical protein
VDRQAAEAAVGELYEVAGLERPLMVFPVAESVEGGLVLIAPDALHKADVGGGEPYGVAVPDFRADAKVLNEPRNLLFVDYLRLCFRWGGFPGWESDTDHAPRELEVWRGPSGVLEAYSQGQLH